MNDSPGAPVVVGVDGSTASLGATRLAAQEAVLRRLPLRVVHAFVWPPYQVPRYGTLRAEAEAIVRDALAVAAGWAPSPIRAAAAMSGPPEGGAEMPGVPARSARRAGRCHD